MLLHTVDVYLRSQGYEDIVILHSTPVEEKTRTENTNINHGTPDNQSESALTHLRMEGNMRFFLVVLAACFLVACSNVKDLKFTKENQEQVMEKVRKSKDLTGEEVGLLMAALIRTRLSGGGIEGKTVGQLIQEQRNVAAEGEAKEKEAKRLAEEAAKKEAEVAAELSKHILVAPFQKSFHKADYHNSEYEDKISIAFVFENKSNKDIKAFKGETIFKDAFGEPIKKINLTYDEGIKAGEKKNWYGELKYNQFMADETKFRNTELENMKFEWKPKAIIFVDGSKLGLVN
jgi:hypothetical protein